MGSSVRLATPNDGEAIRKILLAGQLNSVQGYSYTELDGLCLVAVDAAGEIQGVIRLFLGKPESWIRQVAVAPDQRGSRVAGELLLAAGALAVEYGSEGMEGFISYELPEAIWAAKKAGAKLHAGTRVRWFRTGSRWTGKLQTVEFAGA